MATLPVSMDDEELFPRRRKLSTFSPPQAHVLVENRYLHHSPTGSEKSDGSADSWGAEENGVQAIDDMRHKLTALWWSRLIIAARGYMCSFYANEGGSEDTLFCFDDAFIYLHRQFVEAPEAAAAECYKDLMALRNVPLDQMAELAAGYQLSEEHHPFYTKRTRKAFRRLFGMPSPNTYYRAYKQTVAYIAFVDILRTLIMRWIERNTQQKNRKGVRFVEDTEWEPDDRVVVFQQFYKGNRTWVMLDFDRHILNYHRPNGVRTIFGDRYVQLKIDDGHKLCRRCGMLEQMKNQFSVCPQCVASGRSMPAAYCSADCLSADIINHAEQDHS